MYILKEQRKSSVRIRLDGRDKAGKNNATRSIVVVDADVDSVMTLIIEAIDNASAGRRS